MLSSQSAAQQTNWWRSSTESSLGETESGSGRLSVSFNGRHRTRAAKTYVAAPKIRQLLQHCGGVAEQGSSQQTQKAILLTDPADFSLACQRYMHLLHTRRHTLLFLTCVEQTTVFRKTYRLQGPCYDRQSYANLVTCVWTRTMKHFPLHGLISVAG